jgi:SAM-dependent methyltransferase
MPTDHQKNLKEIHVLGGSVDLEITRLRMRDQGQITLMGGLFPERNNDFTGFSHVLDLPCRAGTWAAQVAQEYPQIEVVGLERQTRVVDYARGLLAEQALENIRFDLLGNDITHLAFPDNYFDLVHINYVFTLLQAHQWSAFLQECLRITRPSGYIRITEAEYGTTNSMAVEQIKFLFLQGLQTMGHTLTQDGGQIGTVTMLGYLLKEAGWTNIQRRAYVDDYLSGQDGPVDPAMRVELMINTMRQTILEQGVTTSELLQKLLQKAQAEMARADFCGLIFLLTCCAQKAAV